MFTGKNNCDHVLMLQQTITSQSDLFSKGQVSLCMLKYHLVTVYLICLLCTSERTARHTVFKFNLGLHSLSQIFVSLSNCMLLDYLYYKLGHENKGNDHQLLIVKQILLVSTLGYVWRAVWRIYILMLGCNGLS